MASPETRPNKKRVPLWKKALVQFFICFVMGFFFGFAPTSIKTSDFSSQPTSRPVVMPQNTNPHGRNINIIISDSRDQVSEPSLVEKQAGSSSSRFEEAEKMVSRRLIIIVSPIKKKRISEMAFLRKLSNTLALVPQPLLWIVTEGLSDSPEVTETLRKTGIMYRHLVYKENFTDPRAEKEHHRNVALNHIEQHKLSGIVHFAELANVYDLGFFDEIREIEGFGAWPVAWVSGNMMKKKSVMMEGPVCDDLSQVIGWHQNRKTNQTDHQTASPDISISSFAFNSSILWDPERWGRSSLIQDDSQNSMNYVKQAVYEDEGKLKGLPSGDCSRIMLWHLLNPHNFKLSK